MLYVHTDFANLLRPRRTYAIAGDRVVVRMPYSEVCCHLRVAERLMVATVTDRGMVQLSDPDTGRPVSFPITLGEAGFRPVRRGDRLAFGKVAAAPSWEHPDHYYVVELDEPATTFLGRPCEPRRWVSFRAAEMGAAVSAIHWTEAQAREAFPAAFSEASR